MTASCHMHKDTAAVAEIRLPGVTPWIAVCALCVERTERTNIESAIMMESFPPPPEIAGTVVSGFQIRQLTGQ